MNIQEKTREELIKELQAVQERAEQFQLLFSKAPLGYQSLDFDGNFIDVNQRWLDILGYKREEVIGKWFGDFLTPAFHNSFHEQFPIFKAQGKIHSEFEMVHKNGSVLFIAFDGRIGNDLKGDFKQTHCILQDITERKQSELLIQRKTEEIELHNQRLESLFKISQYQTYSIQELLDFALNEAIILTNSKIGYIYFYNETDKQFVLNTWSKEVMHECTVMNPQTIYDLDNTGCWGEAVRQRKPIIINDYQADNPLKKGTPDGHVKLHKFLTIPVISDNKIVAVAGVANKEMDYDSSDVRQLTLLLDSVWKISERIVLVKDLTIAKEIAEESKERYRSLLDNLDVGIVVHAPDTSIVMNNPKASELLGLSEAQMRDKKAIDEAWRFVDEDNISLSIDKYPVNHVVNSKRPIKNQILGIRQPGKSDIRWVTVNGFPKLDSTGNITEIVISIVDITERKLAEASLRESEERFKVLHNASFGGIAIHDKGKIMECNQGLSEMMGYSRDELLLMDGFLLIAPGSRELVKNNVAAGFEKPYEAMGLRKNGEIFPMMLEARRVPYKGKTVRTVEFRDITERKQAEEALIRSERELKNAQQITHIGSWYLDAATNQVVWTEELYKMYGFDPELPVPPYTEHQKLFTPESWELLSSSLAKTKETGIPYELELKTVRKDSSNGWMWVRGETVQDKTGKIVGLWGAAQDISLRKHQEQELIIAKEHAEESDRLKSAFLANMSHEIRTPMNGILGFASLLKEPDLTGEDQQKYIQIIEKSGARMLNIINDLVDISKIESGQMAVSISETNVNEQIESIYAFFKPMAEAKGMQLFMKKLHPANKAIILTDREKVNAILTNLLMNAVKHASAGFLEVGYEKENEHLLFFVKDTGVGIREDQKKLIFERFRQGDDLTKHFTEGAGLGLSISKAYVEMLGGKMWVYSEPRIGSTIYFTIPYNSADRPAKKTITNIDAKEDLEVQIKKLKILIVEDDESSEAFITTVVEKFGHEVLNAANGVDAVDVCRNKPDIDLILMDIRMPGMGGYEATRQIRQFNEKVIIIAQTAYALMGDREKAIDAGCNEYLSKPINKEELRRLIQKYFKN